MGLAVALGVVLYACDNAKESTPAGPSFAAGPGGACDFVAVKQNIRSYFPGNGRGSTKDMALTIASSLEAHCDAGEAADYTAKTFDLLKWFEIGLEGPLPDGSLGSPSTGNDIIQAIITMTSDAEPDLFDACGDYVPEDPRETCHDWEGAPTFVPDFTQALMPRPSGSMFAVIASAGEEGDVLLGGSEAICSGPSARCLEVTEVDAPEIWGFAPTAPAQWSDVQDGNPSLFWGYPILFDLGETPLAMEGAAFFASSIPFFADFPGENQIDVTFCSPAEPTGIQITALAHDESATEPGTVGDWCVGGGHVSLSGDGFFGTLASLARSVLTPAPLFAGLHADSPTGGIGGFGSSFFAFVTDPTGILEVLNGPLQDATTEGPILGADGQPLAVEARTQKGTVIENVQVAFVIENNNGSIPSGNFLTSDSPDVVCADATSPPSWFSGPLPPGNTCVARTGPDQTLGAGVAVFEGLSSSKNGGFKVTIGEWTGSTSPFTFNPVSAGQFNNNPN